MYTLPKFSPTTKHKKTLLLFFKKYKASFFSVFILVVLVLIALNPKIYISSTLDGLTAFTFFVLPALLPFFVFTKLLTNLKAVNQFSKILTPFTKTLFNAPAISNYVFFMSILSGYPVGAKVLAECYEAGFITKAEAKKIVTFTSNSGPMFIIGTVGAGMLYSTLIGVIILVSHILGSLLNGIFYNLYTKTKTKTKKLNPVKIKNTSHIKASKIMLDDALQSSITALLMIGAYITLFFTIIALLTQHNVFLYLSNLLLPVTKTINLSSTTVIALLEGFIEITKGCISLSLLSLSLTKKTVLTTGVISFGGLCIMFQALTFLKKCGVSAKFYFLTKLTHSLLSMFVCYIILQFL